MLNMKLTNKSNDNPVHHFSAVAKTLLVFAGIVITFFACKKDPPKTIPAVTTATVADITTTTATGGGTIMNSGNDAIIERGIVYSNLVATPTLGDSKVVSTGTDNSFDATMTNLTSGTTYYVRAYATNSVGTAYGDVVNFITGNAAPLATDVSITGTPEVDMTLTATYEYSDQENDPEGT